jgi:hypothetical protein
VETTFTRAASPYVGGNGLCSGGVEIAVKIIALPIIPNSTHCTTRQCRNTAPHHASRHETTRQARDKSGQFRCMAEHCTIEYDSRGDDTMRHDTGLDHCLPEPKTKGVAIHTACLRTFEEHVGLN